MGFCLLVKVQIKAFVLWFCSSVARGEGLFIFINSERTVSDHKHYWRFWSGFIFANGYIDFCELSETSKAVKSPEKHPGMKSKFCFYICVMFQGFQGEGAVTIEYMKHVHSLITLTS